MPVYFAYGINMDRGGMALRCPRSRAIGAARLFDHRFFIMRSGYASVRPERGAVVYGLLWDLGLADVPALDRFEDVGRGLYAKVVRPVVVPGGARDALIYEGCSSEPGPPQPGYMEAVLAAAETVEVPRAYLSELETWLPRSNRTGVPNLK